MTENCENTEDNEAVVAGPTVDEATVMSKRQKKRLIKLEQWEVKKKEKRLKEKQKYKEKRASADYVRSGPSRKALKRVKVDVQNFKGISIAIDLTFEDAMTDKDVAKCIKQLLRVYTVNRRSANPVPLYFAGIQDGSRTQKALEKNDGYQHWDVQFSDKTYLDIGFEKEKIVYLTAESDTVLDTLETGMVYVIGGLVDHNQQKGLCHEKAIKAGVKTARLPLSENVSMKTRTVLAIIHGELEVFSFLATNV